MHSDNIKAVMLEIIPGEYSPGMISSTDEAEMSLNGWGHEIIAR